MVPRVWLYYKEIGWGKFKNGKCILLIMYVDDILLANDDKNLLLQTKKYFSSNFDMKDMRKVSYILET